MCNRIKLRASKSMSTFAAVRTMPSPTEELRCKVRTVRPNHSPDFFIESAALEFARPPKFLGQTFWKWLQRLIPSDNAHVAVVELHGD
jgi:hypothetical protein